MRVITQNVWGIASGRVLLPFTVRQTRREAISDYCKDVGFTWEQLRQRGHKGLCLTKGQGAGIVRQD